MSERFTAPQDDALYLQMCAEIEEKLRRAAPLYTRRYPHVSTLPAEGLRYTPEENNIWTSSFLPGMMCLAAKRTGDAAFLQYKDDSWHRSRHGWITASASATIWAFCTPCPQLLCTS